MHLRSRWKQLASDLTELYFIYTRQVCIYLPRKSNCFGVSTRNANNIPWQQHVMEFIFSFLYCHSIIPPENCGCNEVLFYCSFYILILWVSSVLAPLRVTEVSSLVVASITYFYFSNYSFTTYVVKVIMASEQQVSMPVRNVSGAESNE